MSSRTLVDFDIAVTRSGSGYVAVVRAPDGRRVETPVRMPFEEYQLKYYISEVTRGPQPVRRSSGPGVNAVAVEMGSALFASMFAGAAAQRLDAALDDVANAQDRGLRLRLDLSGAPELAELPWEFLFHPERKTFLALSPDVTIVRYVQTPEPVRTLTVKPPLRILAMASSPSGLDPLDVALERSNLQASLQQLIQARMVEIDWAPQNTLAAVTSMLAQRDYHVFHFMGHGAFIEENGMASGHLLFEDADGAPVLVSAERLGQAFRRTVRLAIINACEGAVGDLHNPSAGVATSLLAQGVPAVVAMQFSISDVVAAPFAGEFYSALAIGLPVDAAVTSARRNVWARFEECGEWATPVLFLRAADGRIFDIGAFESTDAQTNALQKELIAATMSNLASGSREVIKRMPKRVTDRWSSAERSVEELYQQAVAHMRAERWPDANRYFKLCNDRAPGYRDIVELWQQSKLQERLAEQYRRLVSAYAEQKWQKVVEFGAVIIADAPSYKDAMTLYNRGRQMLGMAPRPAGLPTASLPSTPPPSPRTLPSAPPPPSMPSSATAPAASKQPDTPPPSLPRAASEGKEPPKPDNRPPSLPGRPRP